MRVLVVDDEPEIRLVVHHAFQGHEVLEAAGGQQALDLLRSGERVDIVLLDVMMPSMSGVDVLKAIRRDQTLRRVPVIMLTAKAGESDHLAAFRYGADAYLTKPFNIEDIVEKVSELANLTVEQRLRRRRTEIQQAELLMRIESQFNT